MVLNGASLVGKLDLQELISLHILEYFLFSFLVARPGAVVLGIDRVAGTPWTNLEFRKILMGGARINHGLDGLTGGSAANHDIRLLTPLEAPRGFVGVADGVIEGFLFLYNPVNLPGAILGNTLGACLGNKRKAA